MSKKITLFVLSVVTVLAVVGLAYWPKAAQAAEWTAKVDPWVMETAVAQSQTEFLVYLTTQADVSGAEVLKTKEAKGQYVFERLTAVADQTQPAVIAQLDALGVEYKSFWVANMIWVRGDMNVVQAMALRPDVAHIYANPTVQLEEPAIIDEQELIEQAMTVEWNIALVGAPDVWAAGYTGQGVVIGGQDTGYDWDHPALINQYRGWDGATADHNYNWHDSITSGNGGSCGLNSPIPCDDHGHGTHTMGTMVGDDGGTNQVGMAPGAKWIGCRNMDVGNGTPASYSGCYQWFIAPTDLNDQNPDPSMAPHVINNSWSCPPSEGCIDPNVMLTVVNNVVAAGIVTAHSAGNGGSSCSTVADPAAIYDASYSVGATNSGDLIASFSSRGPVTSDGSNRMKPDISAPGVNIRSSIRGGGYQGGWNGTSMAAPHVAGLVGLLISAEPSLAGDVATIETLINQTAVPRTSTQGCGGNGPNDVPNNVYGWGRIDALAAFYGLPASLNLDLHKTVSADMAAPGDVVTYTLSVTNTHPVSATTGVVLTDTLPAGTMFMTATMPHNWDGTTVTWQTGSLAANSTWTVEMVVQVTLTETGTISNDDYAVRSDDVATIFGDPVLTTVEPYSLQVSKSGPTAVGVGDLITYSLSVLNSHPFAAQSNLMLTDTIPDNTIFITASVPYTTSGTDVIWQLDSLAAGATWDVMLVVQTTLTDTGTITNANYVASSSELPAGVTGAPVTTQVMAYALTLAKETAVTSAAPGDLITYTLTVNNPHATNGLTGIILTDTIPVSTTLVTATLPHTTNGIVVRWDQATLNPGESFSVTLVVQVHMSITQGFVENSDYGVSSNEITGITGPPIVTTISIPMPTTLYLPFVVRPNQPPNAPTNPSPTDGATDQPLLPILGWQATDPEGHSLIFSIYWGTNNPPDQLIATNLVTASYAFTEELSGGTTYYWQIVVEDELRAATHGPVWSFTTLSTFALDVVNLVNDERVAAGCSPLNISQQLTTAALGHSTDMALNDFFSHTGSNGSSPWERITDTGYSFLLAAENIAGGYSTPEAAVTAWMNSPGHRDNILNCALEDTGVGYYFLDNDTGNTNFRHYWTQVFATPATP